MCSGRIGEVDHDLCHKADRHQNNHTHITRWLKDKKAEGVQGETTLVELSYTNTGTLQHREDKYRKNKIRNTGARCIMGSPPAV